MASDLNPVAVLLVISGTRGNRVLFRYPYSQEPKTKQKTEKLIGKNPYASKISENLQDVKKGKSTFTTFIKDGVLTGFSNQTLANLLIVKSNLCGKKISIEIDDVRFVGFPSLLHVTRDVNTANAQSAASRQHNILALNVVFVLRAKASESVVSCYQELAQQLTVAISHEEKRCQYLSREAKIMIAAYEEASVTADEDLVSPLRQIIHHSGLAKELKSTFDSLESTGQVLFYMNQWVEINFCLPHKIHTFHGPGQVIQVESIYRCLTYVRPYHGILLRRPEKELLNILPLDSSPSLIRLIKVTTPVKNLKTLALETDLSITQIYQLVCQMVYWGFAMIIYPLCQSNLYVLSSTANTASDSDLCTEFSMRFPGLHLLQEMSRFSYPSHMHDNSGMMAYPSPRLLDRLHQVVVWMLQHRLLNQLHTYVNFLPARKKELHSYPSHSTMSSTHSSNSSVQFDSAKESKEKNLQVVEESYLSVLLEDPNTSTLDRTTSMSDLASVNSEESGGQSTVQYMSQLSKSPSQEANSDGSVVAEDTKAQWRIQDDLLNELNPEMKAAILRCPASRNQEDLQLFSKLYPYFNGKHHLEEMMYYENLRRSQLVALLDKYKEVLILASHEDPATSLL